MTDRRPDIHCTGCGRYCYSLSHKPWEQVFPDTHYCEICKVAIARGVRTIEMLARTWGWKSEIVLEKFKKVRAISQKELETIRSFQTFTGVHIRERKWTGNPKEMTAVEWREIAKERLAKLKRHYTRRDITLLSAFIASAPCRGNLLPLKKKPTKREKKSECFV